MQKKAMMDCVKPVTLHRAGRESACDWLKRKEITPR